MHARLQEVRRVAQIWLPWVLLAGFLLFCLSLVLDYGSGQDENWHMPYYAMQLKKWRYATSFDQITEINYFYGMLLDALAYYLSPDITVPGLTQEGNVYVAKHYVTLVFCFTAYLGLYFGLRVWCSNVMAMVLAIALLALSPQFFMHTFNDPKDAPFAAILMLSGVMCGLCVAKLQEHLPHATQWRGYRWCLFYAAAIGVWIGLATSMRVAGLMLLGYAGIAWLLTVDWRSLRKMGFVSSVTMLTVCALVCVALLLLIVAWVTPTARLNPVMWIIRGTEIVADFHRWRGCTVTNGVCINVNSMTSDYLITWVLAQTPIPTLVMTVGGVVIFLLRWRSLPVATRTMSLIVLLLLVALPVYLSLAKTRLYNGGRHFMFMAPPMAYFSAVCLLQVYRWRRHLAYRSLVLALVLFLYGRVATEMIHLHPYEQAYINEIFRREKPIAKNWYIQLPTVIYKEMFDWARVHLGTDITYTSFSNTWGGNWGEHNESRFYQSPNMRQVEQNETKKYPHAYLFVDYHLSAIMRHHYIGCESKYVIRRMLGAQALRIAEIWDCRQRTLREKLQEEEREKAKPKTS